MNPKLKSAIESYGRHTFVAMLIAAADAIKAGETDMTLVALAAIISVVGPAIRAVNPKDPAFGMIADTVTVELDKLAKAEKKKKTAKKK